MAVTAGTVLTTSRTFLNDDLASLWTDPTLFPKLAQAHRELQTQLRLAACPVMKTIANDLVVAQNATVLTAPPADLVEPIRLWEKETADPQSAYIPMTESDPLPIQAQAATLIYWLWNLEAINFIGATVSKKVRMMYWRSLTIPAATGDSIGFINGELFLAPRTAAIAAISVGNKDLHDNLSQLAVAALGQVILANRGRAPAAQGATSRP